MNTTITSITDVIANSNPLVVAVVGGIATIIIYTIQEFISKFSIEPIRELSIERQNICYNLIFYANKYTDPGTLSSTEKSKVKTILRDSATNIISKSNAIPWYRLFSLLRIVPSKKEIFKSSSELIGISNSLNAGSEVRNSEARAKIEKLLKIPTQNTCSERMKKKISGSYLANFGFSIIAGIIVAFNFKGVRTEWDYITYFIFSVLAIGLIIFGAKKE